MSYSPYGSIPGRVYQCREDKHKWSGWKSNPSFLNVDYTTEYTMCLRCGVIHTRPVCIADTVAGGGGGW